MELELFSGAFFSALLAIILIDLVLAGDNALIIGLVARNLPKDSQKKVIFWGTFGAIAIRALMAILVVYILAVPGFMLAGGLALVWIARKLLTPQDKEEESHLVKAPAASFAAAVRTIIIADAVMGIDNVLAIGGASHGSILLILIGLAISVPIIVWGSQLVIKLVDRYPSVILVGGAVLLVGSLASGERLEHWPSTSGWLALVYLILFGSIIAFSAYQYLLRNVRPAAATSYAYVNPAVAVLLGTLFAGERIGGIEGLAMLVIISAVVLIGLPQWRATA